MNYEYVVYSGNGMTVNISRQTLKLWNKKQQTEKNDKEQFGVLIGGCNTNFKEYWIESITVPYMRDKSYRNSFYLQDKKHQKVVDHAFNKSNGKLVYLGTWHTHPENYPSPSTVDIKDWLLCIKRNKNRQLFFVIVGILETCLYFYQENKLIKMNKNND